MTFEEFKRMIENGKVPKTADPLLLALWHDARGDWKAAHEIAQSKEGVRSYDRLHAYLHRAEGDTWNANYWYRRAGTSMPSGTLAEEWEDLVRGMI